MSGKKQEAVISVKGLSKTIGSHHILNKVDLNIHKSESVVVIGRSGTGKSVLIKNILGLMLPDAGSQVIIKGQEVSHIPIGQRQELAGKIGVLFQGGALFDSLPVWQNVAFALHRKGVKSSQAQEVAEKNLQMVGLDSEAMYKYPAELSGGMQKRVALARAIATKPEIIFFDEPTSGLDPVMSTVITDLISKCSEELGATTITISHDIRCSKSLADRILMIEDGEIIWEGSPKQIESTKNRVVYNFINGIPAEDHPALA
jgi:phospholipid/cholesterol/gamma-HCH transport system ATP-binding protein